MKSTLGLNGVPETMLWTLHNRATEALRADGIIKDEKAIEIYQSIEYDYEKSFGKADPSHAVRSVDFDRELAYFLADYPDGTVVNLGEGLETQRFRFNDQALWLSVDLPESIAAREHFIQPDARHLHLSVSATDRIWFDSVDKQKPVFITAQGLFMYLAEEDVKALMQDIFKHFDHCYLMFDTIPEWFSNKTLSKKGLAKTKYYTAPKMPWGINRDELPVRVKSWLGADASVMDLGYSIYPRSIWKWIFLLFGSVAFLKKHSPSIVKVTKVNSWLLEKSKDSSR